MDEKRVNAAEAKVSAAEAVEAAANATRNVGKAVRQAADTALAAESAVRVAEHAAFEAVVTAKTQLGVEVATAALKAEAAELKSEADKRSDVADKALTRQSWSILGSNPLASELYALAPSLVWGLVLLLPGENFKMGPGYYGHAIWPEEVWSALHLGCVLLSSAGWFWGSFRTRQVSMLTSVCLWGANTALFVINNPLSIGLNCVVSAIAGVVAYLQLGTARVVARAREEARLVADVPPRA